MSFVDKLMVIVLISAVTALMIHIEEYFFLGIITQKQIWVQNGIFAGMIIQEFLSEN